MTFADYLPNYDPVDPRARRAGLVLMGASLVAWLAVGFDIAELRLIARQLAGGEVEAAQAGAHSITGVLVFVLKLGVLIASAVTFLDWLYQARINLRSFGVRRLTYTRGWALGAFAVPFLNLVRPYQVVREIWKASNPEVTDPFGWTRSRVPWLLPLWWGSFVAYVTLEMLSVGLAAAAGTELDKLQIARAVGLAADVAAAASASAAYFLVAHLTDAQRRKRELTRDLVPKKEEQPLAVAVAGGE